MLGRVIRRVVRELRALRHPHWNAWLQRRIDITCSCTDAVTIPKVLGSGRVFRHDGRLVQRMHQGILVPAGGYEGEWMTEIIRRLRGHHEPQEELLFHHLLPHCRPGSRMVEIGTFWAYYTAWFLSVVPGGTAVCLEPDANNAACGRDTLALNGLVAAWVMAAAGRTHSAASPFRQESDAIAVSLPVHGLGSLLDEVGRGPIELLHVDAQGAELPFLESLTDPAVSGLVRFVVVSTHHASISGSPTTHEDCLRVIRRLGGIVLAEYTVEESFSGDGLIVASLAPADAAITLPVISRCEPAASLFGFPQLPGGSVTLADSHIGPMLVSEADTVIGRHLRAHGTWEEHHVADVVRFLRRTRSFESRTFVAVGANIGTDLLRALRDGMFAAGVALEMDPHNFRLLAANAALNLTGRPPLLLNVAAGDAVGEMVMERSADNFGDHRIKCDRGSMISRFGEESRSQTTVMMTTLDDVERDYELQFDGSTLFWIDTQGYEGQVLAGAATILARQPAARPAVVCELWPYGIERAGGRDQMFAFLAGCHEIRNIRDPLWQTVAPLTFEQLHDLYDRLLHDHNQPTPPHVDLLCVG